MALGRPSFLGALCRRLRGFCFDRFFFLGLELLLAFGLQFPLQLLDPRSLLFDLVILGRILSPQGIDLPQERVGPFGLLVRSKYEHAQRRTAQVRTVANMRTTVVVFGVETKVHRQPFLGQGDRCRQSTLLSRRAQ